MKITDIKKFIVGNPHKNWLFVKVYTDEGIVGLGEATAGLSTMPQASEIDELFNSIIGEDPLQPEKLWHKIYKNLYLKTCHGLNGIVLACWDILGKFLNVPVWKLLGGKQRDKLRVYANGWYGGPRTPESYTQKAMELVEKGYTALKLDPFGSAYLSIEKKEEDLSRDIIKSIRDAVGNSVDICIEAHDRFSIPTAIRIASWLEEFNPMFIEAPVITCDIQGAEIVAKATKIPVATGERFTTLQDFKDLTAARSIAYSQPEVMNLGLGVTMKACAMSEANSQLIACHQAQSPLCTAINAHIHGIIPNFLIHECFDDCIEPWVWELLEGVPRVNKGYLDVPEKPGWGVELNEKEALKHPYSPKNFLRLFDEGWERQVNWEK